MIKYTAEVRAVLRASGMSDADITNSEIRDDQGLLRIVAAIYPRPAHLSQQELKRLEQKLGGKVLELMGLKCPLGKQQ
jgi:hypothetical protein